MALEFSLEVLRGEVDLGGCEAVMAYEKVCGARVGVVTAW